jgi:hypothetical protein
MNIGDIVQDREDGALALIIAENSPPGYVKVYWLHGSVRGDVSWESKLQMHRFFTVMRSAQKPVVKNLLES